MCLPSSAASSGTPAIAVATASRSSNRAPQESLTAGFVQGVADALVGGAGLAVDAVGVDLEQDGDTVAGAARPRLFQDRSSASAGRSRAAGA
jgi:hypothetical protein